jgi:membrane protease YdiL (CAAX protease family)
LLQWLTAGDSSFTEGANETLGQTPPQIPAEQKCNYCGRPTDPQSPTTCAGCGAPRIPPIIESFNPAANEKPVLNARNATLILLAFIAGQFCLAAVVGFIFGFGQAINRAGGSTGITQSELNRSIMAPATLFGFVGGGIAMIWLSRSLLKDALRDTTELGAAWVLGHRRDIAKGLLLGIAVALCYLIPGTMVRPQTDQDSLGPLARMAMTPGLPQIAWFCMALFLAPPLEELLFRGVVYGGYRKSFGPTRAAWLTTSIFALLHITEVIHFLPALFAIASMALVALRMRLRSSAIGPAIAVHFGYNFVIAGGVIFSTWLRNSRG